MKRIRREFFFTNVVFNIYQGEEIFTLYGDVEIPVPINKLVCDVYEINAMEDDTDKIKEAVYNLYDTVDAVFIRFICILRGAFLRLYLCMT